MWVIACTGNPTMHFILLWVYPLHCIGLVEQCKCAMMPKTDWVKSHFLCTLLLAIDIPSGALMLWTWPRTGYIQTSNGECMMSDLDFLRIMLFWGLLAISKPCKGLFIETIDWVTDNMLFFSLARQAQSEVSSFVVMDEVFSSSTWRSVSLSPFLIFPWV